MVAWLRRHERELAVDPVILGEIRFGILLLPRGRRRNRRDFEPASVTVIDPFG